MSKQEKHSTDNDGSSSKPRVSSLKKSKKRKLACLQDNTQLKKKKKVKNTTSGDSDAHLSHYLKTLYATYQETPDTPDSTPQRKMSSDVLHQQAQYIAEMFKIMNNTRWNMYDQEYYILSNKWLTKWKQYANYEEVVKSIEGKADLKSLPLKPAPYPGPISNDTLVLEQKDYFHDFNNIDSHYNLALRDTVVKGKDFIIVSKSIWDYLHSIYGGLQIMRRQINVGVNGNLLVDYKLMKVTL